MTEQEIASERLADAGQMWISACKDVLNARRLLETCEDAQAQSLEELNRADQGWREALIRALAK